MILIGMISTYSCEDEKPDDRNWMSFDGNIEFTVMEYYPDTSVSEPQLYLIIKTKEYYPCFNYPLITEMSIDDNTITVDILGVDGDIGICATAFGPATGMQSLNMSTGFYNLVFNYKNKIDIHTIDLTDTTVIVSEISSEFSNPFNFPYFRYIQKSFTYGCDYSDSTEWICDDFIDSLSQLIQIEKVHFPDSVFTPYDYGRDVFLYENDSDFEIAGEFLKSYSETQIDTLEGIYIFIKSWKNKTYYSWM